MSKHLEMSILKVVKILEKKGLASALIEAKYLYRKNQKEMQYIYLYASLLGDFSQFEMKNYQRDKKESIKLLNSIIRSLNGKDEKLRYQVKNEYYYHTGQFLKQYKLGLGHIHRKKLKKMAEFSIVVGMTMHAHHLLKNNHIKRATKLAKTADIMSKNFLNHYPEGKIFVALCCGLCAFILKGSSKDGERAINKICSSNRASHKDILKIYKINCNKISNITCPFESLA
jgi:hypothetical protein